MFKILFDDLLLRDLV